MARNRSDEKDYDRIAQEYGLEPSDVRNCVFAFFDSIEISFRRLPFSTPKKIFSRKFFAEHVRVWNMPYLGRLGPSYSRYLTGRSNEAKGIRMGRRADYSSV